MSVRDSDSSAGEDGLIRCICGFSDDDGFTVQCEKCNVWQHIACCAADGDEKSLPEVYECERCNTDPEAFNVLVFINNLIKRRRNLTKREIEDRINEGNAQRNHRLDRNPLENQRKRGLGGKVGYLERMILRIHRGGWNYLDINDKDSRSHRIAHSLLILRRFKDFIVPEDDEIEPPQLIKYSEEKNCVSELDVEHGLLMPSQFSREMDGILSGITKSDGTSLEMANGRTFENVFDVDLLTSSFNRFLDSEVKNSLSLICKRMQLAIQKVQAEAGIETASPALPFGGDSGWYFVEGGEAVADFGKFPLVLDAEAFNKVRGSVKVDVVPGLFSTQKIASNSLVFEVKGVLTQLSNVSVYTTLNDAVSLLPPFVFPHPASIVSSDPLNPILVDARKVGQDGRSIRSYCGGDRGVKWRCNAVLRTGFGISSKDGTSLASLGPCDQLRMCIVSTRGVEAKEEIVVDGRGHGVLLWSCICRDVNVCRAKVEAVWMEENVEGFKGDEPMDIEVEEEDQKVDVGVVPVVSEAIPLKKIWMEGIRLHNIAAAEEAALTLTNKRKRDVEEEETRKSQRLEMKAVSPMPIDSASSSPVHPSASSDHHHEDLSHVPMSPVKKKISLKELMARKKDHPDGSSTGSDNLYAKVGSGAGLMIKPIVEETPEAVENTSGDGYFPAPFEFVGKEEEYEIVEESGVVQPMEPRVKIMADYRDSRAAASNEELRVAENNRIMAAYRDSRAAAEKEEARVAENNRIMAAYRDSRAAAEKESLRVAAEKEAARVAENNRIMNAYRDSRAAASSESLRKNVVKEEARAIAAGGSCSEEEGEMRESPAKMMRGRDERNKSMSPTRAGGWNRDGRNHGRSASPGKVDKRMSFPPNDFERPERRASGFDGYGRGRGGYGGGDRGERGWEGGMGYDQCGYGRFDGGVRGDYGDRGGYDYGRGGGEFRGRGRGRGDYGRGGFGRGRGGGDYNEYRGEWRDDRGAMNDRGPNDRGPMNDRGPSDRGPMNDNRGPINDNRGPINDRQHPPMNDNRGRRFEGGFGGGLPPHPRWSGDRGNEQSPGRSRIDEQSTRSRSSIDEQTRMRGDDRMGDRRDGGMGPRGASPHGARDGGGALGDRGMGLRGSSPHNGPREASQHPREGMDGRRSIGRGRSSIDEQTTRSGGDRRG